MDDSNVSVKYLNVSAANTTSITETMGSNVAFFQRAWKGLIMVPSAMLLFNIWVVAAFITYALKTNAFERRSRRDMNGGIIFKAAITSECLATCRYISTIAMYFVGLNPNAHKECLTSVYVNNVLFVAPLIAMYVFLWGRQRAFYQHPLIGRIFNRSIAILSRISLALIVTLITISLCVEMGINRYESSDVGCRFVKTRTVSQFRFIGYAIVWISGQALMMSLFVYPLSVHSKSLKTIHADEIRRPSENHTQSIQQTNLDSTRLSYLVVTPVMKSKFPHPINVNNNGKSGDVISTNKSPTTQNSREKKLYNLMRRTLCLASISIVSDLTAMGVSGFLVLGDSPYYVMCLFLDADTTVNVVTVLLSFHCWKDILFFRNQCASCIPRTRKGSSTVTESSVNVSSSSGHMTRPPPRETG